MRILVTGAAGFIGSHVVEAFAAEGHAVTGLDVLGPQLPHPSRGRAMRPPRPNKPGSGSDERLIRADVRDADAVAAALSGVDLVCHQAAMVGLGSGFADAPDYVSRNDLGTALLLAEMARAGVRRLVLASSMVIYGEGRYECPLHGTRRPGPRLVTDLEAGRFEPGCPDCGAPLLTGLVGEDAPADPRNVYAATKLMQEHLAASWARVTGGAVAALRYHNVYGPRMPVDTPYAGVAAIFRSAWPGATHLRCSRTAGNSVISFMSATWPRRTPGRAVGRPPGSQELSVRSTSAVAPRDSVGELATELSRALAGPQPKVTGEYRLGDVRHIVASNERLRTELDWCPRVSFAGGLAEFAGLTRLAQAT